MDLSKLAASETAILTLLHPTTGEALDARIEVYGRDSTVYRKAQRRVTDKRLARASKGANRMKLSAEEIEEEVVEVLAECTAGWHQIEENGKPVAFSIEAAKDLYRRYGWVREQVDVFMGDREGFFQKSGTPSSKP